MNPESEPPESDVNGHVGRIAIWEADAQLREALRTLLAPYSSVWALEFLTTDGATRERIKSPTSLDILVVTDSASLAQRQSLVRCVQDEKPDIVRVVCSHYSDAVTALLSVPFAHSAIDNPFDGDVLARGLSRAIRLRQTMACIDVRRLIGSTNAMPAVPKTYSELVSALADSTTGILQVTEIIEQDVGMSARIMHLVSSALFALPKPMGALGGAVAYLGVNAIRALVLADEIRALFPIPPSIAGEVERLQARSLTTAKLAQETLRNSPHADDAFLAGMFHGIGQLILAARAPSRFLAISRRLMDGELSRSQIEQELLGVTSAQIGAYLLGLWGLPMNIVDAVAHHECPEESEHEEFGVAWATFIGWQLSENPEGELTDASDHSRSHMLERWHSLDHLDEWRSLAKSLTAA